MTLRLVAMPGIALCDRGWLQGIYMVRKPYGPKLVLPRTGRSGPEKRGSFLALFLIAAARQIRKALTYVKIRFLRHPQTVPATRYFRTQNYSLWFVTQLRLAAGWMPRRTYRCPDNRRDQQYTGSTVHDFVPCWTNSE